MKTYLIPKESFVCVCVPFPPPTSPKGIVSPYMEKKPLTPMLVVDSGGIFWNGLLSVMMMCLGAASVVMFTGISFSSF